MLTVATGAPPTSAVVPGAAGLQSVQTNAPAARFSPGWAIGANSMPSSARTPPGPRVDPSQRSYPRSSVARQRRLTAGPRHALSPVAIARHCTDVRRARDDRPVLLGVLGSAAREFRDVLRAATVTHRRLRDQLVVIIVATVGVDLLCAIAAFLLERHSQQTEIKSFGSAVFWTTTQLLTVSSQIKNPISVGGRVLDVFMEIYAITVIAALAGALGSFLQKRGQEIDDERR